MQVQTKWFAHPWSERLVWKHIRSQSAAQNSSNSECNLIFCLHTYIERQRHGYQLHTGFCSRPFWTAVLYCLQPLMMPLLRNWNPPASPSHLRPRTGCSVVMVRQTGTLLTKHPYFVGVYLDSFFSLSSLPCIFLPGHCLHEIFALREGKVGRVPDMVVWPSESINCVISVVYSPPHPHCITDPPPWLRWFKVFISAEVGTLICMSGDVIRDVMGQSVDSQYSAVCSFTAQRRIMSPRLVFCCCNLRHFIMWMGVG